MPRNQFSAETFATVVAGTMVYAAAYYIVLWCGSRLHNELVTGSWFLLGAYKAKMKLILLLSPVLTSIVSQWGSGVLLSSYTTMGTEGDVPELVEIY
jgi:hypothetical protein